MSKQTEFEILLGQYMVANPQSENPITFLEIFGVIGLVEILKKADGRPIEFVIDETIIDGIVPTIDGKPI